MQPPTAHLGIVTQNLNEEGENRPSQEAMAEFVAEQLKNKGVRFIEAGTGTGKSFAYLVPVVVNKKTTVVATATIALQDQLIDHDLPHVISSLQTSNKISLLKGRNNYLCQQKLEEIEKSQKETQLDLLKEKTPDVELKRILEWAEMTETGDKEEITPSPQAALWRKLSVGANECPGAAQCPSGDRCYSEFARRKAYEADVVVTNHHLYGLDIAAGGTILPEHEVVIFDEAHQLPEILGRTCGSEVSSNNFRTLAALYQRISTNEKVVDRIEITASTFEKSIEPFADNSCDLTTEIVAALIGCRDIAERIVKDLRALKTRDGSATTAKIERCILGATHLQTNIDDILNASDDEVLWVESHKETNTLRRTPLSLGSLMQEQIWDKKSAICTSATLPQQMAAQLGTNAEVAVERVGSPFDYENQAMLYCPSDLPNPRSAQYGPASHKEMKDLIKSAGGRALCLFTSYSAMQEAQAYLGSTLRYPVFVQGEDSKNKLLERFKADSESVLLATMSFWQGVDIPGETLNLVIINRIPFPRPNDPVIKARHKHAGPNYFREVDLPRAQILLAQAAGRLIRSTTDRGVVAILDSRLANNKHYRWDLIQALPPFKRSKNKKEIQAFLTSLDKDSQMLQDKQT